MQSAVSSHAEDASTNSIHDFEQYTKQPFDTAPYVHPFRAPAYHAQQLRSLHFAKTNECRVLWIAAYDSMKSTRSCVPPDRELKAEERKEQWLKFHERKTNGIPGLLPLVLNLPVRFTEAPNKIARQLGIFKHTRGCLKGWQLPEDELRRIEGIKDNEIVLNKIRLHLYIEVPTASSELSKVKNAKIYQLVPQWRTWSLDNEGNACTT